MFERGEELERGLRPLSFKLPSPAINAFSYLPVILAGEGSGVRRQLPAKGKQNLKFSEQLKMNS
jgi:hypothetical protein